MLDFERFLCHKLLLVLLLPCVRPYVRISSPRRKNLSFTHKFFLLCNTNGVICTDKRYAMYFCIIVLFYFWETVKKLDLNTNAGQIWTCIFRMSTALTFWGCVFFFFLNQTNIYSSFIVLLDLLLVTAVQICSIMGHVSAMQSLAQKT